MRPILALILFVLPACAGGPDAPVPEVPVERVRPAADASAEPAAEPVAASAGEPVGPSAQDDAPESSMPLTVRLRPVGPALAEDGAGGRAEHPQAVAVDLRSDGWPGEAMEPSLHVAGQVFTAYTHADPVTLRFVVAGPELVPEGAVATVKYGERPVGEVVLSAVEAP